MVVDGLFGNEQRAGDIGIAAPFDEMRQHAEFARRQSMGILLVAFLRAAGDAANPCGTQLAAQNAGERHGTLLFGKLQGVAQILLVLAVGQCQGLLIGTDQCFPGSGGLAEFSGDLIDEDAAIAIPMPIGRIAAPPPEGKLAIQPRFRLLCRKL